ncbi:hypothetical protein VSS74_26310 [Conexibacter stalactiti]|uniref:Uncharacterized protein n=1 Tax=Conexibacter stalactiti TaxID=1940611 RepID=A0ABU4HX40_9ACTN|nr:hypothetical protein [Conexibacter stalactiti]MDW5597895.1 hypothetical protein [Conexibacter stalactiti]MEC5038537.1 hypothetical protein [Conexibacter stalactiti]
MSGSVRNVRRLAAVTAAGALLAVTPVAAATTLSIAGGVSPLGAPPGTPLDVSMEMALAPPPEGLADRPRRRSG